MNAVTQKIDRPGAESSGPAFARLLQWLDDGADSQGERYLEMRRRLVAYFDRRNRPAPDMLADETFDRVSRTLEDAGAIKVTPPARYCYVVARFVPLEDIRRGDRTVPYDEARPAIPHHRSAGAAAGEEGAARSLDCLTRCLEDASEVPPPQPDQSGIVRDNLRLGGDWRRGMFGIDVNESRYGGVCSFVTRNAADDQRFAAKWLTDVEASLRRSRYRVAAGAQNLFDIFPDRNATVNSINGIQTFPSQSPFGFNGRALYAGFAWTF